MEKFQRRSQRRSRDTVHTIETIRPKQAKTLGHLNNAAVIVLQLDYLNLYQVRKQKDFIMKQLWKYIDAMPETGTSKKVRFAFIKHSLNSILVNISLVFSGQVVLGQLRSAQRCLSWQINPMVDLISSNKCLVSGSVVVNSSDNNKKADVWNVMFE